MLAFGFIFVVLSFGPGSISAASVQSANHHAARPITRAPSSWCTGAPTDVPYPAAPAVCCSSLYSCNIFIESGQTKYGITNKSAWTRRHCNCDAVFNECLQNNLGPREALTAYMLGFRHDCLRDRPCSGPGKCKVEYELVNMNVYVAETSSSEED